MKRKLYQQIALTLDAYQNCTRTGNIEWRDTHEDTLKSLVDMYMPNGSGFDSGTQLDIDASSPDKLVFNTSYHTMDNGMYGKWLDYTAIVTPSLTFGYKLKVQGSNKNGHRDYVSESMAECLNAEIDLREFLGN